MLILSQPSHEASGSWGCGAWRLLVPGPVGPPVIHPVITEKELILIILALQHKVQLGANIIIGITGDELCPVTILL